MCLAIPGKIIKKGRDRTAEVDFGGVIRSVQMDLLPGAKEGEYVIVHAGFAIQKMSETDAKLTLGMLKEAFGDAS
jgi:hydrogenase expression/formation protein HypC